ncbi:MAG TPA: SusC/RagA family TonB-linked outer membrane protein [Gemmatimonadaceae bacterium]|nr:SusC/RagA family TonB-linked outer membrane protein [Gemmatimonadaceae bacterium]
MHRTQVVVRSVAVVLFSVAGILGRSSKAGAAVPQRADSTTITGRVASEGGVPIAGAVVSIPRLKLSTQTNDAGAFRLLAPTTTRAESLHVTRLGYRPADVSFTLSAGQVSVNAVMAATALSLDQIVVTGTAGNQESRAQSAVVATIDASDIVAKASILNINELMYARTPGVSLTVASGASGANTRIDIRGQASISLSNNPLVFIDGVRTASGSRSTPGGVGGQTLNALDDLNPDDIESIEIVKGPAAATLYGADASAGVIQVLTKKGRTGVRRFSQRLTTEYDNIDPNFTPSTNYGICNTAAIIAPTSKSALCVGKTLGTVVSDNVLQRNNVFSNGWSGVLQYSAQGGGDNFGYYVSASSNNEQGTTPGNFLNHRTGRANFNWTASPKMSVDASVGLTRADDKLAKGDQDTYSYMLNGEWGQPVASVTAGANGTMVGGWLNNNVSVQSVSAITNEDATIHATPSATLHYTPVSWFTNRFTMGADYVRTTGNQTYPLNSLGWYSGTQNTGQVSIQESNTTLYTVDYLGNISQRLGHGGWISSDLSFGTQWINSVATQLAATGSGLTTNASNLVSSGTTTAASQGYGQSKSLGYIGQEQIGFNDRLFLQFGARIDRNSAFGSSAPTFFLPKAGITYTMSDEPAIQHHLPSFISTFRVRAAYGTTGRSPSITDALQTYSKSPYLTDAGVVTPGVSPGSPGNPDIKPERGVETEGGFDAGFFHDRAGFELTYFSKTSKDLLLRLPLAPSSGFATSPLVNIGEVSNKGLEMALRATPVDRKNLTWDFGLTMNTLNNTIVNMGSVTPFVSGNNQCFKPGIELGAWCLSKVLRVDTVAKKAFVSDTAVAVGGSIPHYESAFHTTMTLFRNVRLYAQFDGKFDYKIYNLTRDFRDRTQKNSAEVNLPAGQGGYSLDELIRRVGPFATTTAGTAVGNSLARDAYMVSGDYVRFRELSVTWTLPTQFAQRLRVAGSSVSVGGRNLHLWTKFDGRDPEVSGADGLANQFRADVETLPQVRRAFARLNLQF